MIEQLSRGALRAACFVVILLIAGCGGGEPGPQDGSETHFLVRCGGGCAAGLECLCGVCTKACSDAASCSPLAAGASCVGSAPRGAEQRCEGDPAPAFWYQWCWSDADCTVVPARACQSGFCRAKADEPSPPTGEPVCPVALP